MNYWITTDTHFGHDKLREYSGRPIGFEDMIIKRHHGAINQDDVLIHLGDFCIRNDAMWHDKFMGKDNHFTHVKKWLIRGNHDKKTNSWYLSHGWDFVADQIRMSLFGLDIVLSHIPVKDTGFDVNVHGHFHNSDHHRHEPQLKELKCNKHILFFLEHGYSPINLRKLVGE